MHGIDEIGIKGEVYTDEVHRRLYATDASAYRELPLAVVVPAVQEDIKKLIDYARAHHTSLIPRTAGTSLAGQVVGKGIVVDVSKNLNKIIELNESEQWVRVQPGVVRDDLNRFLKPYGLYFGPETSTANRAMIGGMIGNNSCGSNSVVYGSTRDHLLESRGYLSDGSFTVFGEMEKSQLMDKVLGLGVVSELENSIYFETHDMLKKKENLELIKKSFPKSSIPRRNTGYAIDLLSGLKPYDEKGRDFNFNRLIAGSEGTLFFITEAKLSLSKLPPAHNQLICIHCHSIQESLEANLVALQYGPSAVELMDHYILECTKTNITYRQQRFFIQGDPKAILVAELADHDPAKLGQKVEALIQALKEKKLGYHYPVCLLYTSDAADD